jgi:hypothetical protein
VSRRNLIRTSTTGPKGPVFTGPDSPVFYAGLLAVLLGCGVFFDHTAANTVPQPEAVAALQGDLAREHASPEVSQVAQWAVGSQDHEGLPFLVVDKARARLFAFDAQGRLLSSTPVLLGAQRGDAPAAPATPAGRFTTDAWRSALAEGIIWVHGDVALELFAVPSAASPGRGLQRLESGRLDDKRISDGSLHVPGDFYQHYLAPLRGQASVAYVLPELMPATDLFTMAASSRHTSRRPS